jgi:glycosyltransferase involved in cell wall biosynthesis
MEHRSAYESLLRRNSPHLRNGRTVSRSQGTTALPALVQAQPLSVLEIGNGWFPERAGGLNRMFFNLNRHLPSVGIQPSGLVVGSGNIFEQSNGTTQGCIPSASPLPKRLFAFRNRAEDLLKTSRIDLVASHFALYTLPILDKVKNLPLVVHFHGPWGMEAAAEGANPLSTKAKRLIESAVYRQAHRYVVLSNAFAKILIEEYSVDPERIRIIPGGVDTATFGLGITRQQARQAFGFPTDRPIVLTVRRLAHRMGLESLINATLLLREKIPDILVAIAGSGILADKLQEKVSASGLDDHVKLLGFIPDHLLPYAYRAADLSIMPTQTLEGFGLSTVESLAAGTPALVTPIGGLPEVVQHLAGDLVLEGCSVEDIADGIRQALSGSLNLPSPTECQTFAARNFDWSIIAASTARVYRESYSSF